MGKEMSEWEWGRYTLALGMGSDAASSKTCPPSCLESKLLVLETKDEGVCASWLHPLPASILPHVAAAAALHGQLPVLLWLHEADSLDEVAQGRVCEAVLTLPGSFLGKKM